MHRWEVLWHLRLPSALLVFTAAKYNTGLALIVAYSPRRHRRLGEIGAGRSRQPAATGCGPHLPRWQFSDDLPRALNLLQRAVIEACITATQDQAATGTVQRWPTSMTSALESISSMAP